MTQRSANNERYLDENRGGKTRKSAASAKPAAARAATVHEPAPKSKKQKKEEARERERERERQQGKHWTQISPDNKAFEDMPEYKRYRKMWWVCLICAIVLIIATFLFGTYEELKFLYVPCLVLGYILVIIAFYIDFGLIRKMRKKYQSTQQGKSKEARAAQKAARAEARAQQQEAEEKFEAAQAAEAEKKANSPLTRISNKLFGSKEPEAEPVEKE